ncbi:hypothetical protein J6590_062370 [Homalodisca vitripennis]|nr:hypothetical protein J6590_062370 [Homalodisca vitripennis]
MVKRLPHDNNMPTNTPPMVCAGVHLTPLAKFPSVTIHGDEDDGGRKHVISRHSCDVPGRRSILAYCSTEERR